MRPGALTALVAGAFCFLNVSCSTTTKSGSAQGSADDFYAATSNPNAGEYDNIYDDPGGTPAPVDDYYGDSSSYDYQEPVSQPSSGGYSGGSSRNTGSSAGSSSKYYTVQRGDTLYRIGVNNGVSVASLRSANNISGDIIQPGQRLVIPSR